MKKMIQNIGIGLLLLLGLTACYEDKGNYDYHLLPEVKLNSLEETYWVTQFDTLKISPEVELGGKPEEDYVFSWKIWSDGLDGSVMDTISFGKELRYPVTEVPGSYTMIFSVCNRITQVKTYKTMKLKIQGIINEGWMVLHEKDGKTDFDLLMTPFISNRVTKEVRLSNCYEQINKASLPGGKGVKIGSYFAGRFQYVYVLTENGGVRLSAVNMQKMYDLSSLVLDGKPLKPMYYAGLPWGNMTYLSEMLISDGRFYISLFGANLFAEPVLRDGMSYQAAPYAVRWLEWSLKAAVYDESQGRFLKVGNDVLSFMEFPPALGAPFDWNHMDAHMVYMEAGFNKYEYAVMEDWTTQLRSLYVLNFLTEDNQYAIAVYPTDQCPEFASANSFAVGGRGNVFYYSAGHKLYFYDYSGSNKAKEILEAPAGEVITHLGILKPNEDYYMKNHPYDNKVLMVTTYNEQTGEGKIYMYYINEANGAVDKSSVKVYGDFGKIIDMNFNYPKYGA